MKPEMKFAMSSKSAELRTQLSEVGMHLREFNKKYNISEFEVVSMPRERESLFQVFISEVELKIMLS
jgi:hypothetical protein